VRSPTIGTLKPEIRICDRPRRPYRHHRRHRDPPLSCILGWSQAVLAERSGYQNPQLRDSNLSTASWGVEKVPLRRSGLQLRRGASNSSKKMGAVPAYGCGNGDAQSRADDRHLHVVFSVQCSTV
jgi:hypothetical protein